MFQLFSTYPNRILGCKSWFNIQDLSSSVSMKCPVGIKEFHTFNFFTPFYQFPTLWAEKSKAAEARAKHGKRYK